MKYSKSQNFLSIIYADFYIIFLLILLKISIPMTGLEPAKHRVWIGDVFQLHHMGLDRDGRL